MRSIGRPKHVRVMAGALEGDLFVGPKAEEHRGLLSIRYPMEHGIVTDWNDMERIWTYIYSKDQLSTFSEEHPVLLTEAPLNPRKNREKAAEIFFETFNVPAWFVSMQAVLSLYVSLSPRTLNKQYLLTRLFIFVRYATGRVTGVVLDSGDGVTHAVPIYEGFAMPNSIMRVDIAGRDVTRHLRALIRKEGFNFRTTAEFEIVRSIKEKCCYLSTNTQKEEGNDTEKLMYTLPDGNTLEIGPARFRAPEVLFRPDLLGEECEGIHEVLMYAIQKSDMDLRKVLYQNIVLSGGSTLLKGFGDRLLQELKKSLPKDMKIRVSIHSFVLHLHILKLMTRSAFPTDCGTSRATVFYMDGRFDLSIAGYLQENVGLETGIRRRRSPCYSSQDILKFRNCFLSLVSFILIITNHAIRIRKKHNKNVSKQFHCLSDVFDAPKKPYRTRQSDIDLEHLSRVFYLNKTNRILLSSTVNTRPVLLRLIAPALLKNVFYIVSAQK